MSHCHEHLEMLQLLIAMVSGRLWGARCPRAFLWAGNLSLWGFEITDPAPEERVFFIWWKGTA